MKWINVNESYLEIVKAEFPERITVMTDINHFLAYCLKRTICIISHKYHMPSQDIKI